MQMMKGRSGTTPSPRTRSRRSPTGPLFDCWLRLERPPTGGPAGAGMRDIFWRCREKSPATAAARQMGARGTVHIPPRCPSCTGTCSGANLRRRAEPAGLQVWQKPQIRSDRFHPPPSAQLSCYRGKHYTVFVLSPWRCSDTLINNYSVCL